MKSNRLLFLTLTLLTIIFRFVRNDVLQFWSDDEEIHAAVVQRMIVTKRPTLVAPQPTLGTSIGSFFHMASIPLFLLSRMDPQQVLSLFSLTGVLTTVTIYLLGREIDGKKVGLVASFLYATSFLAGLYDRRWWPITWTPLLSAVGLWAAVRLVKSRNDRFVYILSAITTTAFHGDPAMILFGLFTVILLLVYRIQISGYAWIISVSIVLIAMSPIALFELRHPGTIVRPLIESLSKKQSALSGEGIQTFSSTVALTTETVRWLFVPKPNIHLEPLLYPMNVTKGSFESTAQIVFVMVILLYFFIRAYLFRRKPQEPFVVALYLTTFFLGLLLFTGVYRHQPQRVYLTLLFPALFIIVGWLLTQIATRSKTLLTAFLTLYLAVNSYALLKSRFMFPLSTRQQVVETAIGAMQGKNFSLYVSGDPYLESGGFTRLFIMAGAIPKKSFTDRTLGWWYRTHSLYLTEPTDEDQNRIVVITPSRFLTTDSEYTIIDQPIDTIRLLILNNETHWFREDHLAGLFET